jgi:O-glycosyl hydrolase
MYDEFAQWWYDSIAAYAAQGVVADYVNIQNEPDWTADWDTCRFDPTENSTNAGYDSAFEAVWQKLNTEMGSAMPKMLASEATGFDNIGNYINNLDNLSHVYGYAHHLYNCNDGGEPGCGEHPDYYITDMTSFNSLYGNKPLFQTEYEYLVTAWTDAMNTALLLHNSLTVEEVTSYLYWDLFWGSGSGLISLTSSSYTINPVYYGFKHYSAFIDSGWQRIDASTDSPALRISAYISPDNHELSIVIINTSTDTDINLDLSLANFSITSGNIYRSSSMQNCVLLGSFNGAGLLTVPSISITTLALTGMPILVDCQQVQDFDYALPADLDGNCYVNYADLFVLADQWLSDDPMAIPPNGSPDIYIDGQVDMFDLCSFASFWLQCNDPEDTNCTHNW